MYKIILLSFFLASCASTAREWGPWKRCGVAQEKMTWDFCQERLHGNQYHQKGMCYPALECRERRTIFNNPKIEERSIMLFCAWGDIECMNKHGLFQKVISNP